MLVHPRLHAASPLASLLALQCNPGSQPWLDTAKHSKFIQFWQHTRADGGRLERVNERPPNLQARPATCQFTLAYPRLARWPVCWPFSAIRGRNHGSLQPNIGHLCTYWCGKNFTVPNQTKCTWFERPFGALFGVWFASRLAAARATDLEGGGF